MEKSTNKILIVLAILMLISFVGLVTIAIYRDGNIRLGKRVQLTPTPSAQNSNQPAPKTDETGTEFDSELKNLDKDFGTDTSVELKDADLNDLVM